MWLNPVRHCQRKKSGAERGERIRGVTPFRRQMADDRRPDGGRQKTDRNSMTRSSIIRGWQNGAKAEKFRHGKDV